MKLWLSVFGMTAAAVFSTPAQAQNYPWCADYGGGDMGGGMNCGFVSFQQCMVTVQGMGGFCERNTLYQPPPGPHPPTRAQRHSPY